MNHMYCLLFVFGAVSQGRKHSRLTIKLCKDPQNTISLSEQGSFRDT